MDGQGMTRKIISQEYETKMRAILFSISFSICLTCGASNLESIKKDVQKKLGLHIPVNASSVDFEEKSLMVSVTYLRVSFPANQYEVFFNDNNSIPALTKFKIDKDQANSIKRLGNEISWWFNPFTVKVFRKDFDEILDENWRIQWNYGFYQDQDICIIYIARVREPRQSQP